MTVSTSEQTLLQTWRALKPDQQKTAVEFVEFLRHKSVSKQPRRSLLGLCADPAVHISADDIAEARREMWGDFPREIGSSQQRRRT
ncbi:MAG: hypothetical protein KBG20_05150 [Caldilineaceae bacterium]|nr:hypothetical protein [Caldilineaceae bacterium]MBP8109711.1 hypothetical protein [Caldilineaceae bacterium]MBP8123458.1 hypothetical protein [Caldilineaceae bacterium]MBP9071662.1 hypothetical protein [Caldilineaceae bacterium]